MLFDFEGVSAALKDVWGISCMVLILLLFFLLKSRDSRLHARICADTVSDKACKTELGVSFWTKGNFLK
jgi:hypothetical protein